MSMWTSDVLPSFFPAEQARMLETSVDGRVIAFTALLSIACSLLFGLVPAWHAAGPNASSVLRGEAGRASDGPQGMRLRRILVSAQVALAVVLLVAAALLVQSLTNALDADPGFGTRNAVLASIELPASPYDAARRAAYFETAVERVQHVAGVEAASLVRTLPLTRSSRRGFFPEGYSHRPGEDRELRYNIVGDEYFDVMRIPFVAGRRFTRADRAESAPVVIVNHELARRYFTGDPIGKHLRDASGRVMEIVGVVKSDARVSIEEAPGPAVYYPLSQSDASRMTIVARTSGEASTAIEPIRRELVSLDRGVPVFGTTTLAAHVSTALASTRLTAALVSVCGGMALLLAVVGLYGVIAYAVVRRRREIGVRVALGAQPLDVMRLVIREGLTVTIVGIGCGILATVAATRALETLLFGISALDAGTFIAVPALLAVVSILAAYVPARRALRLSPMSVLRQE